MSAEETFTVTLPADVVRAIDRRIATAGRLGREQVIADVLAEWASRETQVAAGQDEGLRPDDLNASNDD